MYRSLKNLRRINTATSLIILLFLLAANSFSWANTSVENHSLDKVAQLARISEALNQQERVRVIVTLKTTEQPLTSKPSSLSVNGLPSMQQSSMQALQSRVRLSASYEAFKNTRTFKHLPLMTATITAQDLENLKQSPDVVSIQIDHQNRLQLTQSAQIIRADEIWDTGHTGSGVAVAVLDTGADTSHPHFADRIVAEACFSKNGDFDTTLCPNGESTQIGLGSAGGCTSSALGCEHGTRMTGIIAGLSQEFSSIAPAADILALQVFTQSNNSGLCGVDSTPCLTSYDSDIIAALEHVYDIRDEFSIAAVNLSLGRGSYSSACDASFSNYSSILDLLKQANIAVFASSGNGFESNALMSPACHSDIFSVGSTVSTAGTNNCDLPKTIDTVSCFSNATSFLDFLAPGHLVRTTGFAAGYTNDLGTSVASAHASACYALLKAASPESTLVDIIDALKTTGVSVTDSRNEDAPLTFPRIDCFAALNQLPFDILNTASAPYRSTLILRLIGSGALTPLTP